MHSMNPRVSSIVAPSQSRRCILGAVFLLAGLLFANASPAFATGLEARVREAALRDYLHGMDAETADREVGKAGVPNLLQLLQDPEFDRRDNVVAFLAYLGANDAVNGLLEFLDSPPADVSIPEEDRALLIAPQALGRIASRGIQPALQALLDITANGSQGGVLTKTASHGENPDALRDDLLEMALLGLAYSGRDAARERLLDIGAGRVQPTTGGRPLEGAARSATGLLESTATPARPSGTDHPANGSSSALPKESEGSAMSAAPDTNPTGHHHFLDYANHVDHINPVDDARVDLLLTDGWHRVRLADFATDVACCNTFSLKGTGTTFGTAGDGLDIVDTFAEQTAVLENDIARAKIVRIINFCGIPSTNILGCAEVNGNSMMLVRRTPIASEAILWIHEYGHNMGLNHNTDTRMIMHATNFGTNNGVTQTECDKFHLPAIFAQPDFVETGVCQQTLCNDGSCDLGETCNSCASDCASSSGVVCGNEICEAGNGEDCVGCGGDCNGQQSGKPANRFCCGDGDGTNPLPCADAICSTMGFQCTDTPTVPHCCGDLVCEGVEDDTNCPTDCAGSGMTTWSIFGTAAGGTIDMLISGVFLQTTTSAGETDTQVAASVTASINDDPTLSSLGVTATSSGNEVMTNGSIDSSTVNDPGLTQDAPIVPALPTGGLSLMIALLALILFLRGRRQAQDGPAA